jgi:flagellar biosynthesis/type III secretory pathway M-ring protein FliF/YscJ
MAGDLRRPSLSLAVAQATVPNRVGEPGLRPAEEGDVSSMAPAAMNPTTPTTLTQIVITVVAAVVVFVAVLVLVLKLSRRRDRRREPEQGRRPGSFGSEDEEDNAGAPGYGRPAGYGPPPLWTDAPNDQRSGWR